MILRVCLGIFAFAFPAATALQPEKVRAVNAREMQNEMPETIFTLLAQEVFDMAIVHCYKESCLKFRPGGGAWPEKLQHKIIVQDGDVTDKANFELISKIDKSGNPSHSAKGFLSHMVAIENAHRINLTSVLILEEDTVETALAKSFSKFQKLQLVHRLGAELARIKWEGLKFNANYGLNKKNKEWQSYFRNGTCRAPCKCVDQLALSSSQQDVIMCRTSKKQAGSAPCRFSSSAAYAVHKSAFPIWLEALEAVRSGNFLHVSLMDVGGHIDFWTAAAMDMWHVLPLLGRQDSMAPKVAKEQMKFRKSCADRK